MSMYFKNTFYLKRVFLITVICLSFAVIQLMIPEKAKAVINTSPAVLDLLHTVEQAYGRPKGMDLNKMINEYPDSLACFLGLAMQRQMSYSVKNPQYKDHYFALLKEVTNFLKDLSDYHRDKGLAKNQPTDLRSLLNMYEKGSSKELNNMFIGDLPLDPYRHKMPMVLTKVEVTQQPVSDLGRLPVREENPDKIILGGEEAPPAESSVEHPNKSLSDSFFEHQPPQPNKMPKKPISKGAILGRWNSVSFSSNLWGSTCLTERTREFTVFRRGSGSELYRGKNAQGTEYRVVSEEQVDPYTIKYKAEVNFPEKLKKSGQFAWMYMDCDREMIDITVQSLNYLESDPESVKQGVELYKKDCHRFVYKYSLIK
ncbi:MAG: hypothetical protein ACQES5_05565 [Thermodesulfobacteriota bacterium]